MKISKRFFLVLSICRDNKTYVPEELMYCLAMVSPRMKENWMLDEAS